MRTIGPLTEIEQQILDDLVAGHPTDCRDSNGSKGRLAAVFLRDVLRGIVDFGGDPDPYGLRIFGADIYGPWTCPICQRKSRSIWRIAHHGIRYRLTMRTLSH
jgi:hypothetical protein